MRSAISTVLQTILLTAILISISSAQEVTSSTHSITVAHGENLSVHSERYSRISTGVNTTDLILNSKSKATTNNVSYLFSELTTKVSYKKDGISYVKEVHSSTSTSLPQEFDVEQELSNLLDLWNSNSADSIVKNVINLSDKSYTFKNKNSVQFNKDVTIKPPKYPFYIDVKDFKVTFGNGFFNTVEGEGVKYSGGMFVKTEISIR